MTRRTKAIPIALFILTALLSPLIASGDTLHRPSGVKVLYYSPGVMSKVARNRTNPAFARTGDYVRGMKLRKDVDGYVAVNWQSRAWLAQNVVIVADIRNPVTREWVRVRLQPVDHQQARHSTGAVQRLEVGWELAKRLQFTREGTTVARIVRVER
jgi:hypothetical protein